MITGTPPGRNLECSTETQTCKGVAVVPIAPLLVSGAFPVVVCVGFRPAPVYGIATILISSSAFPASRLGSLGFVVSESAGCKARPRTKPKIRRLGSLGGAARFPSLRILRFGVPVDIKLGRLFNQCAALRLRSFVKARFADER